MMRCLSVAVAVLWLAQGSAFAEPAAHDVQVAQQLFAKANTAYNLGRFAEAVELFSKAYEAWPQPEFLYNIAQSHRLARNCKSALHFYKRFRSLKDQDTSAPLSQKKRDEIERFIVELTECVANTERSAGTPPDTIVKPPLAPTGAGPTGSTGTTAAVGTGAQATPESSAPPGESGSASRRMSEPAADAVATAHPGEASRLVVIRLVGGVALLGAADLGMPAQPVLRLASGHPIHVGRVTMELGAGLSFTPLPYMAMGEQKTGRMLGARATAVASYPVTPALSLSGQLGVGVVSLSGLVAGNPLSADRMAATFMLPSFALGVGLDYELARGVIATVSPFSIALSRGGRDLYARWLREIDIVVGIGYRQ
jgi:hypothetical protein